MAAEPDVSARERQILDCLYRRGSATAAEVREGLPDALSDSAVRTMLRRLEEKGWVAHRSDGARFVYKPTVSRARARRNALGRVLRTFFDGSPTKTVAAFLDLEAGRMSDADLDELIRLIREHKGERR